MTERIEIRSDEDGIADVRLNRPDRHNALDRSMFEALQKTLAELAADTSLRVVVLSGSGPSFCAGLDVASFAAGPDATGELLERGEDGLNLAQRVCLGWRRLPVPVIAALHGKVYGGGLQIALGADVRLLAPDAELSIMEVRWGLIPDMGITRTLRGLVSEAVARELTFTGRTVDADEAVRLGFGSGISTSPHESALALARQILARSPDAVRAAKKLFNEGWHADERTALRLETSLQRDLLFSPNQIEAVTANFEKRPPVWK